MVPSIGDSSNAGNEVNVSGRVRSCGSISWKRVKQEGQIRAVSCEVRSGGDCGSVFGGGVLADVLVE